MRLYILALLTVLPVSIDAHFNWGSARKILSKVKSKIHYILGGKRENADGRPWFCHDLMCPTYKKVGEATEEKNGYEERCYPKTMWVATEMEGPHTGETSFSSMFEKLFKYIQGENVKKEKIDMTAPVAVSAKLKEGNSSVLVIRMHFFVPPSQEKTIPKPTREDVNIVSYPASCFYVHSFGGFVMSIGEKLLRKQKELEESLKKAGKAYDKSEMLYAGYDSPFRLIFRHNEVWFKVKSEENIAPNIISSGNTIEY